MADFWIGLLGGAVGRPLSVWVLDRLSARAARKRLGKRVNRRIKDGKAN